MVQLRCQIFRQVKQTEEARVNPLLTKFVTHDGKDASKCAAKALAVYPSVLPSSYINLKEIQKNEPEITGNYRSEPAENHVRR